MGISEDVKKFIVAPLLKQLTETSAVFAKLRGRITFPSDAFMKLQNILVTRLVMRILSVNASSIFSDDNNADITNFFYDNYDTTDLRQEWFKFRNQTKMEVSEWWDENKDKIISAYTQKITTAKLYQILKVDTYLALLTGPRMLI